MQVERECGADAREAGSTPAVIAVIALQISALVACALHAYAVN